MAKSVLDIVIKLSKQGGADKETVTGLVQVKNAIMDAVTVAGTLVAAGYAIKKGFDATVGTMVAYADQVRSIAQVSGLSAEESSKLIQVTDDLKISQEDLLKVMQKNGDQYDYSVAGLAAMSEQYMALGSSQEKAAFMQERFGKSWGNFVELMEQGADRITEAGDDINKALILDQKALDQAREYEKNVDELNDTMTAYKVSIGNGLLPVLNDMFTVENRVIELMEEGQNPYEARRQAAQELQAATDGLVESEENLAQANEMVIRTQEEMNAQNTELLSTLGSVQSIEEKYQEKANGLAEERIALEQQKRDLLSQGYSMQSAEIQDINTKLGENSQAAQDNAAEHDLANKRIILGLLERKLTQDGILDDNELNWLLEKGLAWGIYTQEVIDESRKAIAEADGIAAAINAIPSSKTIYINTNYTTSGADQIKATNKQGRAFGGAVSAGKMYEVNELGMPELLNFGGKQMLMMPESGNGYVSPLGGGAGSGGVGGGSPVIVNVTMNSVVNTADMERAKRELGPLFVGAIRDAQANGVLR